MKLTSTEPRGATVFITDLNARIGLNSVLLSVRDAVLSADLIVALDRGLVQLEVTDTEKLDPRTAELLTYALRADAKREGTLLFIQAESAMMNKLPVDSPNVPIRAAVFESIM